jgi:hypothetical protein
MKIVKTIVASRHGEVANARETAALCRKLGVSQDEAEGARAALEIRYADELCQAKITEEELSRNRASRNAGLRTRIFEAQYNAFLRSEKRPVLSGVNEGPVPVLHGTSSFVEHSILRRGLQPGSFVTLDRETAVRYAVIHTLARMVANDAPPIGLLVEALAPATYLVFDVKRELAEFDQYSVPAGIRPAAFTNVRLLESELLTDRATAAAAGCSNLAAEHLSFLLHAQLERDGALG